MQFHTTLLLSGLLLVVGDEFCPGGLHGVFADMHDGDKKEVTFSETTMTIKPSGNNQTWVIHAQRNLESSPPSCSASVDFNVPGKPSPPPVNLTATFFYSVKRPHFMFAEFEFTDPTGTLAAKDFPLNRWVQLTSSIDYSVFQCPTSLSAVFADMHDGDEKKIMISGTKMTIKPSGNNQTWVVESTVDAHSCSANIDFNVPGKPGPPPVNLTATLVQSISESGQKWEWQFTDPSGTLAAADYPLNHWVQIGQTHDIAV